MTKYSNHDHYIDGKTGVLKNKLGITDAALLEKQEANYAAVRSFELAQKPIKGHLDLRHLKAIHKHLFSDVYAWAGKIRDVDISRGESFFAHHNHIETAAEKLFRKLAEENYLARLTTAEFSERAAYYLGEINVLHPFREGNGRTQREFISHLAYKNGFYIDWKNITRKEMIQASIESMNGDYSKFAEYIEANIRNIS